MLHALAHSPRLQAGQLQERPSPSRIAAFSGAIAVNVIALLLLLMPMTAPQPAAFPDADPSFAWIVPDKQPELVPVVSPPQAPPQKIQPAMRSQPQANIAAAIDPVIVDQGSEMETPVETSAESGPVEPVSGPVAAVRLEYAAAPAPAYPRDALLMRLQGTVVLQVLVDVDGRPLDVQVRASSGHRQLDDAARRHVLKRWMFHPAMRDGRPVQAIGLVPVAFSLQ